MSRFVSDGILSEKSINILPALDPTLKLNASCPASKLHTTSASSPSASRRPSLTKTFSDASAMHILGSSLFISPRQTGDILNKTTHATPVPIVDCRSQMDFGTEHLRSAHNVNCRAKLIARKLISKRLEEVEPSLLIPFQHYDMIILYDQSTEHSSEEQIRTLPIYLVVQAAKRSNKTVYIIQGGFEAIKRECPHLIECSVGITNGGEQLPPIPATPDAVDKENFVMSEVCPRVFVGNAYDAHNPQRLKDYGITHVINATPDLAFCDEKIYRCLRISIHDLPSENISKHFDSVAQYIDEALGEKSHKILVHCSAGISRSPTLVLAYMIKKHHLTLEEALKQMRQARSIVDPNFSFIMQLRSWEKSCLPKADTIDDTRNLNAGAMPYANVLSQPSSRYCGSTTGIKKETKACADAAIPVQ